MKSLALIAFLAFSFSTHANDIGAAISLNPVVAGAVNGVKKQYKIKKCDSPSNIQVKDGSITATINCIDQVKEFGVIIDIQASVLDESTEIMLNSITFNYAG